MALILDTMSELDAVNLMLSLVGESPVVSLDDTGSETVAEARQVLHETSQRDQTMGRHYNTDDEFTLAVNGDSKIPVASNILDVDTSAGDSWVDVTQIGLFLYNKDDETFIFDNSLTCRVVWFRAFDDLPNYAKQYYAITAGRRFQARKQTDVAMHRLTEEDETFAKVVFFNAEMRSNDKTMTNANRDIMRTTFRRTYYA